MATTIQAVTRYRPRLISRGTVGLEELGDRMQRDSLVNARIASHVLGALFDSLVLALRRGEAVHLPGIARFSLDLRSDGDLHVVVRVDHRLRKAVRSRHTYRGPIRNGRCIGLGAAEMVALWNEEHPDDPVVDAE